MAIENNYLFIFHKEYSSLTIEYNNVIIGRVCKGVNYINDIFAIGYNIEPEHRNKGIMNKAIKLFIDNLNVDMQAVVKYNNNISKKLLLKHGFELVISSDKDSMFPTNEVYIRRSV